ncbi:hypothetical protein [Streptomyces poonensis]|uniref:Uncharacterized protein n=1 Tax=Streptomyces poonensis TaxID=68255 RepID=A0A918UK77_9ACTN|nr:hypothetical protein [Streptomyces poonensis]GGZ16332.1 hypothetical protein GCM10010365_40350 [Streptomyces poonensis]GLJ90863.1 hypothetical protein GCM10017589_34690 [Streptomyces poonensis]
MRRLRLVGRTPGQAAVIPFPQDDRDGDRHDRAGDGHGAEPPRPVLDAKSRKSRVPTIPRLPSRRRDRS